MKTRITAIAASYLALSACSSSTNTDGSPQSTAGHAGVINSGAGRNSGGAHQGGATNGGSIATGGLALGGTTATGGVIGSGGAAVGGAGGTNATGGTTVIGGAATGGAATGGVATGGVATGGVATGGVATGGASSTVAGCCGMIAGNAGNAQAGSQQAAGTSGTTAVSCAKPEGSDAGHVCAGCGIQVATYYHCDGTRYIGGGWQDYSNNSLCLATAYCGADAAYWTKNDAGTNGATCDQFCQSIGATCANACTAFSSNGASSPCPASTAAGYNQYETYGCESNANNLCSSTVVHPSNAFNAFCCCQGLGTAVGGAGCVKTEGSAAGEICVGCGYKAKTYFHCNGTRYVTANYAEYSSDATCLSEKLCGNTLGPAWTRNASGQTTCDAFCSSVGAKCVNGCTAFSSNGASNPCPASTTAGYNQYETYGCESNANNQCNSTVVHPSNAYNAYCCCEVL